MAAIYSLVCENGSSGDYWSNLSATDRLRYGAPGSERVYTGLFTWYTGVLARTNPLLVEICEIGNAFTENTTKVLTISCSAASLTITASVKGKRTTAFHGGVIGEGYIFNRTSSSEGGSSTTFVINNNVVVDGFSIHVIGTTYGAGGITVGFECTSKNMILARYDKVVGNGLQVNTSALAYNCLVIGFAYGLFCPRYSPGKVRSCIFTKNNDGVTFEYDSMNITHSIIGCISISNITSNWDTYIPTELKASYYNAGAISDLNIPDSLGGTTITMAISDFADHSNNNFYPASSSSPQVGAGGDIYGIEAIDILGAVRPNYNPSGEQSWDIGAFEFDHGFGIAPTQVLISFSGIIEGSVLAVYKTADDLEIITPTTIGATGSYSTTLSYTGDVQITIKVRKGTSGTRYLPYEAPGLITSNGYSLIVNQVEDTIAEII